jgi:metal-sulfur cluster biosynthetic enzyme
MEVTEASVRQALKTVIDPELGVNIVDLGLIYKIEILRQSGSSQGSRSAQDDTADLKSVSAVLIVMTLTTPGCPLGGWFLEHVKEAVVSVVGVEEEQVQVEITFDPPWTMELMDLEAKAELGFD